MIKVQLFRATMLLFLVSGLQAESLRMGMGYENAGLAAMFRAIYADAGVDLTIDILPTMRVNADVDDGIALGFLYAESTMLTTFKSDVVWLGIGEEPFVYVNIEAFVRKEDLKRLSDPTKWGQLSVGLINGFPVSAQYADKFGIKTREVASSAEKAIKMLAGRRFDIMFAPQTLLYRNPGPASDSLTTLSTPVARVGYWVAIPAKYRGTELENRIRASFLKNKEVIRKAYEVYLSGG